MFCKKVVLGNFPKFTGIHLYQGLSLNKVAGLRPEAYNFIKKETLAQVFPCEFCEISNDIFSNGTLLVAASERWKIVKPIMMQRNLQKLLEIGSVIIMQETCI